jgi:hypothetical protein
MGDVLEQYMTKYPVITFLRHIYRQHTDVYARKNTYQFVNNKVCIEPTEFLGVIEKIWLGNCSNIKNVLIFLVGQTVDIDTLNFDTEIDITNEELQLVHRVSINGLRTSNKIMWFSEYSDTKDTLVIPHNRSGFIPHLFTRDNKKLVFVIEPENDNIVTERTLIVKYGISNCSQEITRFKNSAFELLLKRLHTVYHDIDVGTNVINSDIINIPLSHIIINTEKDFGDDIDIKFNAVIKNKSNIDTNEYITIEHDLVCTERDPEYDRYVIDSCDTYLIDPYSNIITKGFQPSGNYKLYESSKFIITSSVKTKIEITYCLFDVLKYGLDSVHLVSQHNPIINEDPINIHAFRFGEGIDPHDDDADNNNNENNDMEGQPIIQAVPIHMPLNMLEIINNDDIVEEKEEEEEEEDEEEEEIKVNLELYSHIYSDLLTRYEQNSAVRKILYESKDCVISWQPIKYNDYYYECDQCEAVFGIKAFKKWFSVQYTIKSCPHCRKQMDHYPQLYKNCRDYLYYVKKPFDKLYNIYCKYF